MQTIWSNIRWFTIWVILRSFPQISKHFFSKHSFEFIFLGIFSKECFCGSSYGRLGKLIKSKCFYPCTGNRLEFCGGISANDIYNTGIQTVTQSAFTTEDKKITTEMTTKFPPETTTVQGSQMSKETTFYTTVELTTATGKLL